MKMPLKDKIKLTSKKLAKQVREMAPRGAGSERSGTLEELMNLPDDYDDSSDEADPKSSHFSSTIMNTSFAKGCSFDDPDSIRSHKDKRPSLKLDWEQLKDIPELNDVVKSERVKEWATGFRRADPRFRIMEYFDTAATLGIDQVCKAGDDPRMSSISPILRMFARSACFTVWRPTSSEAIRKMILGLGVGKGLDIKGKSAKEGRLSGYVPFLQIHDSAHISQIYTLPKAGKPIRLFFQSQQHRQDVARHACTVAEEMLEAVRRSKKILASARLNQRKSTAKTSTRNTKKDCINDSLSEAAKKSAENVKKEALEIITKWDMVDAEIIILDDYANNKTKPAYGVAIPERVFWEIFVIRRDITRQTEEHRTGRQSFPAFQDMNFVSLRQGQPVNEKSKKNADDEPPKPRPCIYQFNTDDPLESRDLIIAYEENGRVVPVVSDFDCFLVGTRGVSYEEPISKEQTALVQKSLQYIETILEKDSNSFADDVQPSWTERWLTQLKEENAPKPPMPPYGYGDPKSISLIKLAVQRLNQDGSVRHGAECFNYTFPQELDDSFLVIGRDDDSDKTPWRYVDQEGLVAFLRKKITQGFAFPLNPKWVLCDGPGWKSVYDELLASQAPRVQESLNCWFPQKIRERIQEISTIYPQGFAFEATSTLSLRSVKCRHNADDELEGTNAMDLAEFQLDHHLQLRRAKMKIKAIVAFMRFSQGSMKRSNPISLGNSIMEEEVEDEAAKTIMIRCSSQARATEQDVVNDCRNKLKYPVNTQNATRPSPSSQPASTQNATWPSPSLQPASAKMSYSSDDDDEEEDEDTPKQIVIRASCRARATEQAAVRECRQSLKAVQMNNYSFDDDDDESEKEEKLSVNNNGDKKLAAILDDEVEEEAIQDKDLDFDQVLAEGSEEEDSSDGDDEEEDNKFDNLLEPTLLIVKTSSQSRLSEQRLVDALSVNLPTKHSAPLSSVTEDKQEENDIPSSSEQQLADARRYSTPDQVLGGGQQSSFLAALADENSIDIATLNANTGTTNDVQNSSLRKKTLINLIKFPARLAKHMAHSSRKVAERGEATTGEPERRIMNQADNTELENEDHRFQSLRRSYSAPLERIMTRQESKNEKKAPLMRTLTRKESKNEKKGGRSPLNLLRKRFGTSGKDKKS